MRTSGLTDAAAALGGGVLAAAALGVAAARPASKPLHPRGQLTTGEVTRRGVVAVTGVPWIDGTETGTGTGSRVDRVTVRTSRAIGLPDSLPDIHGLAMRVWTSPDAYGDLLLASTGLGALSRFTLTGSRDPLGRPMTTLLPYRTATGPLLLAARPTSLERYELLFARPRGDWSVWADLVLLPSDDADPVVPFDPVLNELPGLENYDWVRRLREPAYRTARASRPGEVSTGVNRP